MNLTNPLKDEADLKDETGPATPYGLVRAILDLDENAKLREVVHLLPEENQPVFERGRSDSPISMAPVARYSGPYQGESVSSSDGRTGRLQNWPLYHGPHYFFESIPYLITTFNYQTDPPQSYYALFTPAGGKVDGQDLIKRFRYTIQHPPTISIGRRDIDLVISMLHPTQPVLILATRTKFHLDHQEPSGIVNTILRKFRAMQEIYGLSEMSRADFVRLQIEIIHAVSQPN